MSVQNNNNNILHKNPNCKMVKDSTNSMYYINILQYTKKVSKMKNQQETTRKKIPKTYQNFFQIQGGERGSLKKPSIPTTVTGK